MTAGHPPGRTTAPAVARAGGVVSVLAVLVVTGFALLSSWQVVTPTFVSYWVVDEATLGVQTVCGPPPNDSSAIAKVVESATQVQVFAECRRPGLILGETAVGYLYDFTVRLASPLAARTVIDGNGLPATQCREVRCGAP